MASGHVNRTYRPNTWLHRPMLQNVKKVLANPEPSTHGTKRTLRLDGPISELDQNRPERADAPLLPNPKMWITEPFTPREAAPLAALLHSWPPMPPRRVALANDHPAVAFAQGKETAPTRGAEAV